VSHEPAGPGASGGYGGVPNVSRSPSIASPAEASALGATAAGATDPRLRLQAIFSVHGDDAQAYATATELIDRLSVLANLPECECDVDISLERAPSHGQGCG
jgi:hypothetical protein